MRELIGRESELEFLESLWNRGDSCACKVIGRRRIGKSELLRRFAEGKRSIYVECVIGSISDNIHTFNVAMNDLTGKAEKDPGFLSDATDRLLGICRESRTLVVIDELPYILQSGEQVASILQHFVDAVKRETDSMVVACGSSIRMMDEETTEYDKPLYGRFDEELKVEPLSLVQCNAFHPLMSDLDKVKLYLTVGGIPQYHLDPMTATYREYVEKHLLSKEADMAEEAVAPIGSEFAPLGRYMAVINAISDGATSLKTISEKSRVERTACTRCLNGLQKVGIVGTVNPMMGSPKNAVYRILDPMVAFCQDIVRESRAYSLKSPSDIYDLLSQRISTFLGGRFEDLCAEYVKDRYKCVEIGRWWGVDEEKEIREIDIAAKILIDGSVSALFGKCKFRTGKTTVDVLDELRRDCGLVRTDLRKRYILFSASGFTDELEEEAEENGVVLVDLEDLVRPMAS